MRVRFPPTLRCIYLLCKLWLCDDDKWLSQHSSPKRRPVNESGREIHKRFWRLPIIRSSVTWRAIAWLIDSPLCCVEDQMLNVALLIRHLNSCGWTGSGLGLEFLPKPPRSTRSHNTGWARRDAFLQLAEASDGTLRKNDENVLHENQVDGVRWRWPQ